MTIKKTAKRFNVICCGRRFGKDVLLQDVLINTAMNDNKPVAWFAPTYRMLLDNWRQVRFALAPVTLRANDSVFRLELITGSVVDMWSLDNYDSARGRKYALACINEASVVDRLQEAWEMVIRPTLTDYIGRAFIASTPKGLNYFHTLYQRADERDDWARFHYRTHDNPFIARSEIEDLRRDVPERVYRQEIMAEFIEDGAYFQNLQNSAVIDAPDEPDQHRGHVVVAGVDWAKSNDYTVITVACRDCNRVVDWWRFNQIDYHLQRERLIEMWRKWSIGHILVETNSIGEPNLEELQLSGLPAYGLATIPTTKPPLIEALNQAFVLHGFTCPRDYVTELSAYEAIGNSGRTKFGAPSGLHDDCVISLALAYRAMTEAHPVIVGW